MTINSRITQLIRKLFLGKISKKELEDLNNWYDSFGYENETTVYLDIENNKNQVKSRILSKLEKEINLEQRNKFKSHYWSRILNGWIAACAAMVIIALTVYLNIHNKKIVEPGTAASDIQYIERINPNGQKSKLILTDGTTIWLNAASKIKFPEKFTSNKRTIFLEGEAFFDVTRDENKPFIIHTKNTITTVYGTSFNIKSYSEEPVQVTVATGKVKVNAGINNSGIKNELTLNPNEQMTFLPVSGKLTKKSVDIDQYISWKEDVLRFDNTKLSEVVTTLERWYDKKIVIENEKLNDCVLVAEYKNEKLYNILQSLKFSIGIDYKVMEDKIIISGQGCN